MRLVKNKQNTPALEPDSIPDSSSPEAGFIPEKSWPEADSIPDKLGNYSLSPIYKNHD